MKRIKASEILAMNPKLTIQELREYGYYGIGGKIIGERFIYRYEPLFDHCVSEWRYGGKEINLGRENPNDGMQPQSGDGDSLREIDFSEFKRDYEKIKASDILQMNPSVNLKGFTHFAINENGNSYAFAREPRDATNKWYFGLFIEFREGVDSIFVKKIKTPLDWRKSLREIDFEK